MKEPSDQSCVRLSERDDRERLLETLGPALASIDGALNELGRERVRVSGAVRITATRQAYEAVIRPVLPAFGAAHPDASIDRGVHRI